MCDTRTPDAEVEKCGRCGEVANPTDSWHLGWPNYGRIQIGYHSQSGLYLTGGRVVFASHPAMTLGGAQETVIEWGNGYKFDSRGRFRMCHKCQAELLRIIGAFFGMDKGPTYSDGMWFEDRDGVSVRVPAPAGYADDDD